MDTPTRLLVISRDSFLYQALKKALPTTDVSLLFCQAGEDFIRLIVDHEIRAVLVDAHGPPRGALPVLKRIKKHDSLIDVVVAGSAAGPDEVLEVVQQGAADVLARPLRRDEFLAILQRIRDKRELRRETYQLERKLERKYVFQNMVSRHPPMLKVFGLVEQIAKHFTAVLIAGEPGTGKQMVARALHRLSPVHDGPFVICECASIPANLFESELFGFRGASSTGADRYKCSLIEKAHGGVLFLDEVAEVSLAAQVGLLRVLERVPFQNPGGGESLNVDVRIIAATSRDLVEAVRSGAFHDDLYRRLKQVEIRLPPLRDRREDILLLVRAFLDRFNQKFAKDLKGVSPDVQKILYGYPWPGNIRELETVLKDAATLAKTDFIDVANLPRRLLDLQAAEMPGPFIPRAHLSTLADLEKEYIAYLLKTTRRNLKRTAQILGISRTTLYNKLKKYKIPLY
ncbi:MAG: sigma-54 dependent transcriptional regulator [Candidatus Aminicenantes bacterium]|nr:sigma-54 dependent transcriptional regulator [Candidatus Aminicenantes bacterium]